MIEIADNFIRFYEPSSELPPLDFHRAFDAVAHVHIYRLLRNARVRRQRSMAVDQKAGFALYDDRSADRRFGLAVPRVMIGGVPGRFGRVRPVGVPAGSEKAARDSSGWSGATPP